MNNDHPRESEALNISSTERHTLNLAKRCFTHDLALSVRGIRYFWGKAKRI